MLDISLRRRLPRAVGPHVTAPEFNRLVDTLDTSLGRGSVLVSPRTPGAFRTVEEALAAAKEASTNSIIVYLDQSEVFTLPSGGILLDGERDYAFVSLVPTANPGSGRPQLVGDIDTTVAAAIDILYNRTITFDGVHYTGDITTRKGRELRVFGGLLEQSTFKFVFSDSMFDAPRAYFFNILSNGGFWVDTVDVPVGFVLSLLNFYNSYLVTNDSAGSPFKLLGNLGPTVQFNCCRIGWSNSVGGVSLFDFEGTDATVQFQKSLIDATGGAAPGPMFANAASGRVRWQGINNEIWRDPASSTLAVDLSGPTHSGFPSVDTGIAPTGRPTGTIYKDRGVTETLLFWNGVAWV